MTSFVSIDQLFLEISNSVIRLTAGDHPEDAVLDEQVNKIQQCKTFVTTSDLFSTNEELDEYSTSSMKYLFLDYYLAKTLSNIQFLLRRKAALVEAMTYYNSYLEMCSRLNLLHEDDKAMLDEFVRVLMTILIL